MFSPSLRKEIRQMAAPAAAVLLLPLVIGFAPLPAKFRIEVLSILLAAVGSSLIAISTFGKEIAGGTLSTLFALPAGRNQWWWEKVVVSFCLLAVMAALFCTVIFSHREVVDPEEWRFALLANALLPWCILGAGIFLTLFLGQPVGAFWLTLLIPAGLATALATIWPRLPFASNEPPGLAWAGLFIAYAVAGLLLARWQLLRWQDTAFGARELAFAWPRRAAGREECSRVRPQPVLRALLLKELNLQQMNLIMFAVLVLLFFFGVWLGKSTETPLEDLLAWLARALWFIVPFTIGAVAVAEERRVQVVEWQHSLPLVRTRQWWVKAGFCLALSLAVALLAAALDYFVTSRLKGQEWTWSWPLLLAACHLAGTTIGLYASSLARNFIQAASFSLGVVIVVGVLGTFALRLIESYPFVPPARLLKLVGAAVFVPLLLILSGRNYRELQLTASTVIINARAWMAAAVVAIAVTAALYLRTWELVTLREPPSGRSIARAETIPSIAGHGWRHTVLSPDGQAWELRYGLFPHGEGVNRGYYANAESVRALLLSSESSWKQMEEVGNYRFGLKEDGTLWRLWWPYRGATVDNEIVDPEPVEPERRWRAISGRYIYLLATDEDDRLWQWMVPRLKGRARLPGDMSATPMSEVMPGTRWKAAAAFGPALFGIQSDGTLWSWGDVGMLDAARASEVLKPTRLGAENDWASFGTGSEWAPILRKTDGSCWIHERNVWGVPNRPDRASGIRWIRVGDRTDWIQMAFRPWQKLRFDMLRTDGSRWESTPIAYDRQRNVLLMRERRVGERNDWVAISSDFGLTADGKAWNWDTGAAAYSGAWRLIPYRFRSKVIADLSQPTPDRVPLR